MVTLAIEGVHAALGNRAVLHGISAHFSGGSMIGIIGPNGAGKSTLARTMIGLLQPMQGRVLIDDQPVAALHRQHLARRIAYLPQGQTLHWPLAVERLVALGRLPYLAPFSRLGTADSEAIEQAMQLADITDFRDRIATELSGGERARVMLARALAVQAPILIADEPLASLDPGHQLEVMDLLRAQADGGVLVIAVLHDLTLAARYCDRLLMLDGGRLVADDAPETVLSADALAAVYGISAWHEGDRGVHPIVPWQRILHTPG